MALAARTLPLAPHSRLAACKAAPLRPVAPKPACKRARVVAEALGIFFSTSSGNTQAVADMIHKELGSAAEAPQEIGDVDVETLKNYDGLIVGAPTWNTGADEERSGTAWDNKLGAIKRVDLKGKPVAVFGLGDSANYGDYYCDAMEELYTLFSATGAKMVGKWPTEGYEHSYSKAEIDTGVFCGLALDQDNQDDLTPGRIKGWVAQVKKEMGM